VCENLAAESFEPTIGAKIPSGLKAHALPPPLIYEMPALKRYTYLKFKGQVLIVNPNERPNRRHVSGNLTRAAEAQQVSSMTRSPLGVKCFDAKR
jgi:hypothetical protein